MGINDGNSLKIYTNHLKRLKNVLTNTKAQICIMHRCAIFNVGIGILDNFKKNPFEKETFINP